MNRQISLLNLRPTQFTLGMIEVQEKVEKMKKMNLSQKEKYLEERRVPCILGPQNQHYSIDRHHLIRACWELGEKSMHVLLVADLSHLEEEDFWEVMKKARWVFLMDQFGNGPHSEKLLPRDIRGMADNPYRSLSWMVREAGGYQKEGIPFIEFYWADIFRKQIPFDVSSWDEFKKAKDDALAFIKKSGLKSKEVFKRLTQVRKGS